MKHMRPAGWVWMALLLGLLLVALMGPLVLPESAARNVDPSRQFLSPRSSHPFGTDQAGRDVLARAIYGSRTSLFSASLSTLIALVLGTVVGGLAGVSNRWLDWLLMRGIDVMLAFPSLLLALTITALLRAGIWQAAVAVGVALLPIAARLVRAAALQEISQTYVEVARSFGAGVLWIARVHVLPNIARQLVAFFTIVLAYALLNLAALDYLGVTGDPTLPTWGHMLADGRPFLGFAPWIALVPGTMLTVTVMSAIGLGDALRWADER